MRPTDYIASLFKPSGGLLGLAPAGVLRVAGRYRYKLLIKGKNSPRMRELLWRLFTEPALAQPMKNVTLTIEPNYDSDL